jgi:tetratricopeptide (TPR) repeat protein
MSRIHDRLPEDPQGQPALGGLLARFLQRQAEAQAAGLAPADPGEVTLYESSPVQPVDARLAWEEAVAVATYLAPEVDKRSFTVPPHWPQLVAAQEPAAAPAFALGNYPQMVRDLHLVLNHFRPAELRPNGGRSLATPALLDWSAQAARQNKLPQVLLAVGSLRLARQFDQAEQILTDVQKETAASWQPALLNERAALAWHQGKHDEALALWNAAPDSVPVLFNRGMACLFLGQPGPARSWLTQAVAQLPESSAWHHLGRLYLTLAAG